MTFIYYVQTFTVGRISRPSIIFSCKGVGRSLSLLCQGLRSEKCAGQVFDGKQITYCDNCERRKQSDLQIPLRNLLVKTNVPVYTRLFTKYKSTFGRVSKRTTLNEQFVKNTTTNQTPI